MKIGLFVSGCAKEGAICAFDLVRYVRTLGHEMALYSPEIDSSSDHALWVRFPRDNWSALQWWSAQAFDLAIFYGVCGFPAEVLNAARRSGATVVVEADTDGRVSPIQEPFRLVERHWDSRLPWSIRFRSLKAGFEGWFWKRHQTEKMVLLFLQEADFIKVESSGPAEILRKFLASRGRGDLAARVVEIPFAVRECFMEPIVPAGKEATILVAGRLGEIQKGPEQTARTLRLLLREDSEVQVELHIRGRLTPEFASLAKASPRVRVCENTSREQLAERLRSVAILFSRSRWETTPVIALEALCSGCTLVAPRELPGYQSLIQEGRFGQTYERNSDQDAVQAIRGELNRWRTGGRDSAGIAAHWRKRASLPNVVEELLELRGRDSRIQVTEQTTAIGNATPIHS